MVSPYKGAEMRVPFRTSCRTIEKVLQDKSEWIKKAVDKCSALKKMDQDIRFTDGESIMFMGKEKQLKIISSEKSYVRLSDDFIEIGINGQNDPMTIKIILENWYKKMAKRVFHDMYLELLTKHCNYSFHPSEFTVRTMKKRWGSCSSKGKIAISYDLVRLDMIYAEYVIIHELCHLIHHNHSSSYYKLLSEVFPQWKRVRAELKSYIR